MLPLPRPALPSTDNTFLWLAIWLPSCIKTSFWCNPLLPSTKSPMIESTSIIRSYPMPLLTFTLLPLRYHRPALHYNTLKEKRPSSPSLTAEDKPLPGLSSFPSHSPTPYRCVTSSPQGLQKEKFKGNASHTPSFHTRYPSPDTAVPDPWSQITSATNWVNATGI